RRRYHAQHDDASAAPGEVRLTIGIAQWGRGSTSACTSEPSSRYECATVRGAYVHILCDRVCQRKYTGYEHGAQADMHLPTRLKGGGTMAVKSIPEGYRSVTAYLNVRRTAEAMAYYQKAFGAEEL